MNVVKFKRGFQHSCLLLLWETSFPISMPSHSGRTILMGHDYAPSVRAIESNWNGIAGSVNESNSRYIFDSFLLHILNPLGSFLTSQ